MGVAFINMMLMKKDYPLIIKSDKDIDLETLHELMKSADGFVIRHDGKFIGYAIYRLKAKELAVYRLFVVPKERRNKVGTHIFNLLSKRLNDIRSIMTFEVDEKNLAGHLFLKAMAKEFPLELNCYAVKDNYYFDYKLKRKMRAA